MERDAFGTRSKCKPKQIFLDSFETKKYIWNAFQMQTKKIFLDAFETKY